MNPDCTNLHCSCGKCFLHPQPATMPVCGCRVGSFCLNVACPHAIKVTN